MGKKKDDGPVEVSSTRVPRQSQAVAVLRSGSKLDKIQKKHARPMSYDPRFESSGKRGHQESAEAVKARQRYSFVYEEDEKHLERLRKMTSSASVPDDVRQVARAQADRLANRARARQAAQERQELRQKVVEREKQAVAEGKTPYFMKRSDRETLLRIEQFKALKSSGKLDHYMQKRSKRVTNAARRHIPNARPADSHGGDAEL